MKSLAGTKTRENLLKSFAGNPRHGQDMSCMPRQRKKKATDR